MNLGLDVVVVAASNNKDLLYYVFGVKVCIVEFNLVRSCAFRF